MTAGGSIDRIVLTGASGMLGQAILKKLARRSDVSVLALYRKDLPGHGLTNIREAQVELTAIPDLTSLLESFRPTVFIHTAATGMQMPRPAPSALREINTLLPARLAEAVAKTGQCSFVQISSGLAYKDQDRPLCEEDPLETNHSYGASKAEAEGELRAAARLWNLPLTILRPFAFTGEGDFGTRLFPALLRSAQQETSFAMTAGDQVRDHSSVDDIAAGVVAAALASPSASTPQIYNLGKGDTRTLREVVTSVIDQLGLKVNVEFGIRPHVADEPMFMVPDTTRVHAALGWTASENIAHAVWRLARESFPSLVIQEPRQTL